MVSKGTASAQSNDTIALDTILAQTMQMARLYSKEVEIYEANVYMKALIETKKKNFLSKFTHLIPNFVLYDKKNDSAFVEAYSRLKYESPNNYFQDIKHIQSTLEGKQNISMLPFRFISINVYDKVTPEESYYLPTRDESKAYYLYKLQSITRGERGEKMYKIGFKPKFENPKLIEGYFLVADKHFHIRQMVGRGYDFYSSFEFDLKMGNSPQDKLLPTKFAIRQSYRYLGNEVVNKYYAQLNYQIIGMADGLSKEPYNLGNRYRVRLDSVPINTDTLFWEKIRPIALNDKEKRILRNFYQNKKQKAPQKVKKQPQILSIFAKNMVQNTSYQYKSTYIKYSGLLNPALLGYSTNDGVAYRQSVNMQIKLRRQQSIALGANADILFRKKHFSFRLDSKWNYEPAKMGYFTLSIGRGNPTYSSLFVDKLKDTIRHSNSTSLSYYKHYYIKLYNSIELSNGLALGVGLDYHIREPNKVLLLPKVAIPTLSVQYNFVPKISLSWTPHQYYLTDRNQKVYVRSSYPTFKLEYAQSIPNWLKSNSAYSKLEIDVSQSIRIDLMNRFNYHVGGGFFVNQKNEYFNDFTYFLKSYFPQSWSDGFGGSFSVLPIRYFNSSNFYLQAQTMYETPRLILTRLPYLNNGVARERLYVSVLHNSIFTCYGELGYGIGNKFLNTAIFFGFNDWKYYNLTAKIEFLL